MNWIKTFFLYFGFLNPITLLAAEQTPALQPDPFSQWLDSQIEAIRTIEQVEVVEETVRISDGAFGIREVRMHSVISGNPESGRWDRDILSMRVNGRDVPYERRQRLERHREMMLGNRAERFLQTLVLPPGQVRRMQIQGQPVPCTLDGVNCLRFELEPQRSGHEPLQRITMWLDRSREHLLRSRILLKRPDNDSPFVITTDYQRLSGLDVPRTRKVEGIIQTRRRLRTFSMLFDATMQYRDYQVFRK